MSKSLPWIQDRLDRAARDELLRARRSFQTDEQGYVIEAGKRYLNFAGNDYLNLAHDPRILAAVERELQRSGVGATASALIIGRSPAQRELEEQLAEFEGQPAAIVFPSGYAANLGTITALVQPGDVLYCDRFNHASLVDGCKLSGAKLRIYRHDDLDTLRRELKKSAPSGDASTSSGGVSASRQWIITESIFSMDGDMAPLRELCDLAEQYGAELIVDEAHATGIYGEHSRGVAELLGVEERIVVRIGTLSKTIACQGGFAVGAQATIDWLWNNARTQMFSTSLSPLMCVAAVAAIGIIQSEPERRLRLQGNFDVWRKEMESSGSMVRSRLFAGAKGPIQPLLIGEPGPALLLAQRLKEAGFLVASIRPPTVPQHTSRLRISFNCAHTIADVRHMARTLLGELERTIPTSVEVPCE
ncbi:MAG: aminotransferase class I/II-fold pyridoxal phosphate-dependent enzyme [Planctomycetaceae bacterium]